MNRLYESIHRRNGFLIKTNQSNDFYGPFKVTALPTKSDPPLAEWVSPIPLSGLFPTSQLGITIKQGDLLTRRTLFFYLENNFLPLTPSLSPDGRGLR